MLCDICQKKEATVHLTEIVNDKVTKMHLCEDCAKEKGDEMETHFGLSDLLAGLADFAVPHEVKTGKSVKCQACGFTFSDFQKVGRLGCPNCYDTFSTQLSALLKRIHGSDMHVGKSPLKAAAAKPAKQPMKSKETNDLQELKAKLQEAIASEAFEEAAVLRDKIREIELGLKKGNKDEA
jgi:protein arginine kinase activator